MEYRVTHATLREIHDTDRLEMFQLRGSVFGNRLGWEVELAEDGRESDRFDDVESVRYIFARTHEKSPVQACSRLLPTTGPNMLADVFPILLHGRPAPAAPDVWEISRFAIATDQLAREDVSSASFGPLAVALVTEAVRYARIHAIKQYVFVTTTAFERLLVKLGLRVERLGAPMRLGNAMSVACAIDMDERSRRVLDL